MNQHFRVTASDGEILDFEHLLAVKLKGDNLIALNNDWDAAINGQGEPVKEVLKEALYSQQVSQSAQFKLSYSLYKLGISQEDKPKSYERLRQMVNKHIAERRLQHNKEDLGHRTRSGPLGATPATAPQTRKGKCFQWAKEGKCSRGDSCPWVESHDPNIPRKRSLSPPKGKGKGGGKGKGKATPGKGKAQGTKAGGSKGSQKGRPKGGCWDCGGPHFQADCPNKTAGKGGEPIV